MFYAIIDQVGLVSVKSGGTKAVFHTRKEAEQFLGEYTNDIYNDPDHMDPDYCTDCDGYEDSEPTELDETEEPVNLNELLQLVEEALTNTYGWEREDYIEMLRRLVC